MTGLDQITLVSAVTFIPLSVGAFVFLLRQRSKILSADQKSEVSMARSRAILARIAEKLKETRQEDETETAPFSSPLFGDEFDIYNIDPSAIDQIDTSNKPFIKQLVVQHMTRLQHQAFLSSEDTMLLYLLSKELEDWQEEEEAEKTTEPRKVKRQVEI